jgi:hypothetical protein
LFYYPTRVRRSLNETLELCSTITFAHSEHDPGGLRR